MLYLFIMFNFYIFILCSKKYKIKHFEIMFSRDQKQNKKICKDENITFYFVGTKIKI